MEIVFEGIILRPWTISYASHLAEIANNKNIADNLKDMITFPYSIEDAKKWIRLVMPLDPKKNFAII
jgi:hypothetical protein